MNYSDKIAIQKTKADIVVGSYYKTRFDYNLDNPSNFIELSKTQKFENVFVAKKRVFITGATRNSNFKNCYVVINKCVIENCTFEGCIIMFFDFEKSKDYLFKNCVFKNSYAMQKNKHLPYRDELKDRNIIKKYVRECDYCVF